LARKAGITTEGLRLLEEGINNPKLTTAYAIAKVLGVKVEAIWPQSPG
jgi:DNA-binding XRE family transcriptional regulator